MKKLYIFRTNNNLYSAYVVILETRHIYIWKYRKKVWNRWRKQLHMKVSVYTERGKKKNEESASTDTKCPEHYLLAGDL